MIADLETLAATRRPRAKTHPGRATAAQQQAPGYWVVVDKKTKRIVAVLVPDQLTEEQRYVAYQHMHRSLAISSLKQPENNVEASIPLATHWGLLLVLGEKWWIESMEALGNPPRPNGQFLAFL